MIISESTERVPQSRSKSIVRQRRISIDNVKSVKITEEEFSWKKNATTIDDSSRVVGELGNHKSSVVEDRLHGNGDVEVNDNLVNESFVRVMDDEDSPWQNGRYKPVSEIVTYYKSLGDWWNVLPKTDNTYNPMSKWYRKEIAPGIPMIPNMARPPLHPHTPKSSFFGWFTREQSKTSSTSSFSSSKDNFTSSSSTVEASWYRRVVTTIVTAVTTVWTTISQSQITARRTHNVNGVHTQRLKGRQIFQEANAWWRLPFVWLYKMMMNIFAVDIGILSAVRRSTSRLHSRTGFEVITLLLLLLPLLLFFGLYRDQFAHHKAVLVYTVERSKAELAHVATSFYDWGAGFYSSIVDYWSDSRPSSSFDSLINTLSDVLTSVGHSVWQFLLYLYSFLLLLPTFLPRLPTTNWQSSTATTSNVPIGSSEQQFSGSSSSMSRDQLVQIVQEAVRDTLKQDSAILIEDTINSPRLKVLLDQVLSEKVKNWDPNVLLSSEQWRSAVLEAVHIYHVENPDKEGEIINQRIDSIEKELNDRIARLEGKMDLLVDKFVTRKTVEDAIKNLTRHFNYQLKIEGEHVMERVLAEITEKVKDEVTTLFYSLKRNHNQVELTTPGEVNLTQVQDYVSVMIERALCLYDADKTGMVDYALESSGGHVLNTRCTESYNAGHQTYVLFGFALWRSSNSPRTLIQPGMHPGECWAFSGQQGYVVLQLSSTIIVTGFTVEHIPRSLAPHGRIDSAPKDFSVWGLRDEDDKEEAFLGRYRFQENGTSLQMFKANPVEDPFRLVELKIESNHGNLEYTCLYRFRVHGVPVS